MSSIGARDGSGWTANLNTSSNRFEVIMQNDSLERAVDTPCGPISRIGRHWKATRSGESFVHQSDARVLSGREQDYATIENPPGQIAFIRTSLTGSSKACIARCRPFQKRWRPERRQHFRGGRWRAGEAHSAGHNVALVGALEDIEPSARSQSARIAVL